MHLVFMYVYHRFFLRDRNLQKSSKKNITIQPVLKVSVDCSKNLPKKFAKNHHFLAPGAIELSQNFPTVPHKNINSDPNLQAVTSISCAALIPIYENPTRISVTAISPQQENHMRQSIKTLRPKTLPFD